MLSIIFMEFYESDVAVEILHQRGAAFHPVSVVHVNRSADLPHLRLVDVPTDHAFATAVDGMPNSWLVGDLSANTMLINQLYPWSGQSHFAWLDYEGMAGDPDHDTFIAAWGDNRTQANFTNVWAARMWVQ